MWIFRTVIFLKLLVTIFGIIGYSFIIIVLVALEFQFLQVHISSN